ncbi:MAG: glycosyltransferase family 9 protein, partial [Gammaproteobacteria bacterium]
MTRNGPDTICVYVGLDLVGDGLVKLPFLRALRHAFPDARITWLAGKGPSVYAGPLAPLAANLIDEVIEDAGVGHRAAELLRRPLPDRAFDLVIDTQRRLLTTLILRKLCCRVFISGAAGFLLSDQRPQLPYRKPAAMIRQMLDLVAVASGRPAEPIAALRLSPAVTDAAARLLPAGPLYVGLAPGAGGRHKCWPLERYVELAQRQTAAGRVPVVLLGPAEAEWAGAFRAVPGARLALQDAAALAALDRLAGFRTSLTADRWDQLSG